MLFMWVYLLHFSPLPYVYMFVILLVSNSCIAPDLIVRIGE